MRISDSLAKTSSRKIDFMKPTTVTDTQEASSLHELDGRAGRTENVEEERRWEVWVKTTRGPWVRSDSLATEEAARAHVAYTIKTHGSAWRKQLAVVEVVAVARTQTVTTRTVRSPMKLRGYLRERVSSAGEVRVRKTVANTQEGSPLQRLVRALNAARQRALYWSGNMTATGKRFIPGRRGRKNRDLEYEMALDDIESLSMDIEALTGKKLKRYDPRAIEVKRWNALNARLVERAGQERPNGALTGERRAEQ